MAFQSQSAQRPPVPGLSVPGRSARHASIPGNVWLFVFCQALALLNWRLRPVPPRLADIT